MSNFPPLRIGLLQGLVALKADYDENPKCLEDAPYDNETKVILRTMFAAREVEVIREVEVVREAKVGRGRPTKDVKLSKEDQEKVQKGIQDLMNELQNLGTGEATLDTNAKIQIIKTKAGLHKELLQMQERVFNIKNVAEFQETVIAILEDLINEADREIFMSRIAPYRD